MSDDKRLEYFLLISGAPALAAAFLITGWTGFSIGLLTGLVIAAAGGLVAGIVTGENLSAKAYHAVAGLVLGSGVVIATLWYIQDRNTLISVELLIPAVLGGLPGGMAYWLFRRFQENHLARMVTALTLMGLMILAMTQVVPGTEADIRTREEIAVANLPAIYIGPDSRNILLGQFGDHARNFLRQVDVMNSLVKMYSLEEAVRGASGSLKRLEETFTAFVKEARSRASDDVLNHSGEYSAYREALVVTVNFLGKVRRLQPDAGTTPDDL